MRYRMTLAKMDLCAAMLVITGCYAPHPPDGIACSEDRTCPDPLICSFGLCVETVPPCVPIDDGAGTLTIPTLHSPITIDGSLADWPTCFISVDPTNAGLVRDLGANGHFASGRFSLAGDGTRLYLAAEVNIVAPLGDQPVPAIYKNNAISVYFDGDGVFTTAAYDADTAQIVVDHANRTQGFHSGSLIPTPDLVTAAMTGDTTFTIEMSLDPSTLSLTSFAPTIGFDIGLVGGDGSIMTSELVWYQACKPPDCVCTNGDSAPYCDARQLGTATFAAP